MATVTADLVDRHTDPDDHTKQAEGEQRHRERNLLDRGPVVHDKRPRVVVPDGERVVDVRHSDVTAFAVHGIVVCAMREGAASSERGV